MINAQPRVLHEDGDECMEPHMVLVDEEVQGDEESEVQMKSRLGLRRHEDRGADTAETINS